MIIFIAMVLVAGIAAYTIINTANQLEITSTNTGRETITEVASGVKISTIEAHNTSGLIDKVVIIITPRSGSPDIAIDSTLIEIANPLIKCVLTYSSVYWVDGTSGVPNIFAAAAYSSIASEFGVIVLKDDDNSCVQTAPVLTGDDSVMITLNTTAVFGGIAENVNILGNVMPEIGSWSIIQFRTPSAFAQEVFMLQED